MTEGAAAGSLTLKSNLISYSLLAGQGPSSEEWWTAALWNTQVLLEKKDVTESVYIKSLKIERSVSGEKKRKKQIGRQKVHRQKHQSYSRL